MAFIVVSSISVMTSPIVSFILSSALARSSPWIFSTSSFLSPTTALSSFSIWSWFKLPWTNDFVRMNRVWKKRYFTWEKSKGSIVQVLWPCQFTFDTGLHLSRAMRKPKIWKCENKGADQLRSNCEAGQCLCFRYKYTCSTIPLLSKYKVSSL